MKFYLNIDQTHKINTMLPKGYKLITSQQYKKKITKPKKKSKITYVPIAQVPVPPPVIPPVQQQIQPPQPQVNRRNKNQISYQEDNQENFEREQSYQTLKTKKIPKPKPIETYFQPQLSFPTEVIAKQPEEIIFQDKDPLTTKQIIGKVKENIDFYVVLNHRDQQELDATIFDRIVSKTQISTYSLFDLEMDLQKIFIKMYEFYPRQSEHYAAVSRLEKFVNSLIKHEKAKNRQLKIDKSQSEGFVFPSLELNKQSSIVSTINKKKPGIGRDSKNITIMDKRILGQNIKKLPSDYLPEICKIVFDTLQTREEYVIDIDTLPLKKVRQLQIYVDDCMQKIGEFDLQNTLRNENDSEESSFLIIDDFD